MKKLAIFDMAGTTIDDRDEVYRVLREATEREGARYSDDEFQQYMGTEKKYAIGQLLTIGGVEATDEVVDKAWEWFRAELRRTYTENPPVPLHGVEDALRGLRNRGVKVALTTGFSREIADIILGAMGWEVGTTIDASCTGDEVSMGRPEPFMIQDVMRQTGITDPADVISAGDTAADIESARRAGVTSVGVLTGHLTSENFADLGADIVLPSIAELPAHEVMSE
ncbi:HAD hydrolase-like protein [Corynebacterium breve]|uniref:HAD hydrolase-like protein n=1 Tax=Corynebacterium breve TaxID=3049799 RepID=A0ABY8VEQ7_9CORY|nr:HAD hydrolase-like protein [Corynebacterium breve]WIM67118.1 HAD hydrolase-like protein [Corynebacterium breve]